MDLGRVIGLKVSAKGARDDKDWPAALLDLQDAPLLPTNRLGKRGGRRPSGPADS
jgi:hypothetical protein